MKTIYYYQTFVGLDKILSMPEIVDTIIVSSIHFDKNLIYLNDNTPFDPIFNQLWTQTNILSQHDVTIMLMIGGAGGAYQELFKNFSVYYPLLVNLIRSKNIQGVDIDIEEMVDINDVRMLITHLVNDFGTSFIITMAPVVESMTSDEPGMGGFSYKELYTSDVGKYIHWFNVQCYNGSFSYQTYQNIINNEYPSTKIGIGMMSGDFSKATFPDALNEANLILDKYPSMCSVDNWEFFDSPPEGVVDPSEWARKFHNLNYQCRGWLH